MMSRADDWPGILYRYIDAQEGKPFEWGVQDCCTFATGAIYAMTGVDSMAEYRGQYNDESSAKKALETIGKGTFYKTLRAAFGNPIKPARAKRGDLMMADSAGVPALLICLGEKSVGPGPEGHVYFPTVLCLRGWSI